MVAGGFGWSAGDIATAVRLVVKISKAFKASGGAASRYQDALGFLHSLKVTLDHLGRHVNDSSSDGYGQDIADQLDRITPHWKAFEQYLQRYDESLGVESTHHRLAKAPRTVQYTLKDLSGEVDRLKTAVAQPLQVVNTLLSLQLVYHTKLVPQTLLTEAQCNQLVDAISLAGVPLALSQRLDAIESSQRPVTDVSRSVHVPCKDGFGKDGSTDELHQQDSSAAFIKRYQAANASTASSLTATCNTEGQSTEQRGPSDYVGELRLLVEDQHWSVIQLLRALGLQLEELKRVNRQEYHFCDSHGTVMTRPRSRIPGVVTSTATTLITTMSARIVTGVVVGKAAATASITAEHAGTAAAMPALESTNPHTSQNVIEHSTSNIRGGSHPVIEQANAHPGRSCAPPGSTDAALEEWSSRMDSASVATIEKQSIHDSVIEPPSGLTPLEGPQYLGASQEQLVVRLSPSAMHAAQASPLASKAVVPAWKTSLSSKVPACVPIGKEHQSAFFAPGRVFMTVWTPAFDSVVQRSASVAELPYIDGHLGEKARSLEMRRFVVLRNEGPYSLCAPIHLIFGFNKVRCITRGPYEIPIVMVDSKDDGLPADFEEFVLSVEPSKGTGIEQIPKHSLLRLREMCMIDHNVNVVDVGRVCEDELPLLEGLWRDANRDSPRSWLFEDTMPDG